MVRVLKRTMVLDISGLPATLGRFEIAKAVDDLYCADFVVKSVQFMPGKRLSSGMRNFKTVFETVSDWSVVKWSVLINGAF